MPPPGWALGLEKTRLLLTMSCGVTRDERTAVCVPMQGKPDAFSLGGKSGPGPSLHP